MSRKFKRADTTDAKKVEAEATVDAAEGVTLAAAFGWWEGEENEEGRTYHGFMEGQKVTDEAIVAELIARQAPLVEVTYEDDAE